MELAERVEQLEQQMKTFRPELHFPVTATLEQRVRWLEIVFEEIKGRDNHGVYVETPLEEKLEKILGNTVYVKPDRITLHSLTADPASVVTGDIWFRSDVGKTKQAIDSVVANARLLRREGDIVPTAEIEDLDTAKVTTGRFPMTRMPDGTSGRVLTAQGVGANPLYSELSTTTVTDFQATDTLRNSNDTGRATPSSTYVKLKETKLGANLAAVRIRFDLRGDRVQDWEGFWYNTTGYARIYKNGSPIGAERLVTGNSWQTFSQDFATLLANDLIQLYVRDNYGGVDGSAAYVGGLRFYYGKYVTHLDGKELQTSLEVKEAISMTNQDPV